MELNKIKAFKNKEEAELAVKVLKENNVFSSNLKSENDGFCIYVAKKDEILALSVINSYNFKDTKENCEYKKKYFKNIISLILGAIGFYCLIALLLKLILKI